MTRRHAGDREVAIAGMELSERRYPSGVWLAPREQHNDALLVVVSGELRERVKGREVVLRPGAVCFIRAGVRHGRIVGHDLTHVLQIAMQTRTVDALATAGKAQDVTVHESERCVRLARRIIGMQWSSELVDMLRLESRLLELLAAAVVALTAGPSHPPPWLASVHDALQRSFRDPPPLRALAQMAGVHPNHLLRLFSRYYGGTPAELTRRWRAEHAVELLRKPGAVLSEIAFACGFSDQSHMGRTLKQMYGLTPTALRNVQSFEPGRGCTPECRTPVG